MPDSSPTASEVLRNLDFGSRIAEDEREELANYFIETDQWRQVRSGGVDVVYGPKGSGKSALYFLLLDKESELRASNINLVTAENPRGATAFRDLATDPPASERDFIELWKLYFLALLGKHISELPEPPEPASKLIGALQAARLLAPPGGLRGLLARVQAYIRKFSGAEGGLKFDALTHTAAVTGKLNFENKEAEAVKHETISLDELYDAADEVLRICGLKIWILLDRLDVAFADTPDLEQNALRALFKTYRDLQTYEHFTLKIFLRTDIWRRLTADGFREASHITRTVTISWDKTSLLNLIIRRSLKNEWLKRFYEVGQQGPVSLGQQEALFYRMFPEQIDSGPNKPKSLEWILSRVQDASRQPAPREVIHFLNVSRDKQYRMLELGEQEPASAKLFSRSALKDALPEVSKVRLEQTLYAEHPNLKQYCERLRGGKTQQTPDTLGVIWNEPQEAVTAIARELVEVGFFEERGSRDTPEFWVPFLYRDSLDMSQGAAE